MRGVHRAPLRSEERHDHANVVGHRRVEPRGGLVEEEDGRARDERESDVHTLLLPARDARDQLAADDGLAALLEPKLADHLSSEFIFHISLKTRQADQAGPTWLITSSQRSSCCARVSAGSFSSAVYMSICSTVRTSTRLSNCST